MSERDLVTFDHAQVLPGGFRMPARMTALPLPEGGVALISPVPITDAVAARVEALGPVRFLIAPNLLHHLYLGDAAKRWPGAAVLAPRGLRAKRPDLRLDRDLEDGLPGSLADAVDVVPFEGAPSIDEHVFFHRRTRTLVVTDLVFNVTRPEGLVAHVALFLVGCHGKLAQSRAWRFFVKDRQRAAASAARLLDLPFEELVPAHGDVVRDDARARLGAALRWLTPRAVEARASEGAPPGLRLEAHRSDPRP